MRTKRIDLVWVVVVAVSVAATLFAAVLPMLATDTACRYAPMAEAFAAGEWREAFHPRFGVGMSVLSGLCCLVTGLDGYSACAAIASLVWGLAGLPIFRLTERAFGREVAWFAILLYYVCPLPLIWGLKGLREPFKLIGVMLMADAILRRRDGKDWLSCPEACLGVASLALFKVDAILVAGVCALVYAIFDRFRCRTWILAVASVLILQPMCWLVWDWTGYWLPAPQFVTMWQKLFGG